MRKKVVAGNWKMNLTPSEAVELVKQLKPLVEQDETDVIFCVPSIDIVPVEQILKDSSAFVGAENMYYEEKGAYTGELSANMLVDAGVTHVILGHSERRQYFNEDNAMVNKKVLKALEHKLIPIICCGETLKQREEGITLAFIKEQVVNAFAGVSAEDAAKCIVAYEPIWAIGTGSVATASQAQEVCHEMRKNLAAIYNEEVAEQIRILYGGSVNGSNASVLFAEKDIDGGLVGGASLKLEFADIVNYR